MTDIVNLTPHPLNISGRIIATSGVVARCRQTDEVVGDIDGIPVVRTKFGEVTDLPDPQDGIVYVVSSITAQAVPHRSDVFVPGKQIRDEKGVIVGCEGLATLALSK